MPGAVHRRPRLVEVEPLERVREVVRVALAADLAVRDDVDPGLLHVAHGESRRVVLRLPEPGLVDPPQLRAGTRGGSRPASFSRSISQSGWGLPTTVVASGCIGERYEHEDANQPGLPDRVEVRGRDLTGDLMGG